MSETKWAIIGRGKAGWHAAAKNVTSSGGDINPGTYWTGARTVRNGVVIWDAPGTAEQTPDN